jgi:biopolymer transport protein ExbD
MALLQDVPVNTGRRPGVRRMKKHSLKTDMTPMVDLGFLLIAFFVVTAQLTEPRATNLNMPQDGPPTKLENSNALTVLLGGDNSIYYYHGDWEQANKNKEIFKTSFDLKTGLGKVIREKQMRLDGIEVNGEGRKGLMVLIKPNKDTNYENVINVLDEILIHDVKKYAIVKLEQEENAFLH